MVIVVNATFLAKTDMFLLLLLLFVKTVSTKSSEKCSRRPETGVREYVS